MALTHIVLLVSFGIQVQGEIQSGLTTVIHCHDEIPNTKELECPENVTIHIKEAVVGVAEVNNATHCVPKENDTCRQNAKFKECKKYPCIISSTNTQDLLSSCSTMSASTHGNYINITYICGDDNTTQALANDPEDSDSEIEDKSTGSNSVMVILVVSVIILVVIIVTIGICFLRFKLRKENKNLTQSFIEKFKKDQFKHRNQVWLTGSRKLSKPSCEYAEIDITAIQSQKVFQISDNVYSNDYESIKDYETNSRRGARNTESTIYETADDFLEQINKGSPQNVIQNETDSKNSKKNEQLQDAGSKNEQGTTYETAEAWRNSNTYKEYSDEKTAAQDTQADSVPGYDTEITENEVYNY